MKPTSIKINTRYLAYIIATISITLIYALVAHRHFLKAPETAENKHLAHHIIQTNNAQPMHNHSSRPVISKNNEEINAVQTALEQSAFRFDIVFIFDALSKAKINDNGDIIVNHNTKALLESGFKQLDYSLTDQELVELQDIIQIGILGKAGKQAAEIVVDYYHYRIAEAQFMQTSYSADLSDIQSHFDQLMAMRRAELGYNVADGLFGFQELQNQYTINAMILQSDPTLSAEEKERIQRQRKTVFDSAASVLSDALP